jgi:hypothetical protein
MKKPTPISSKSLDTAKISSFGDASVSPEDIAKIDAWATASGITPSESFRQLVEIGLIKAVKSND